jgi:hypothetical protein
MFWPTGWQNRLRFGFYPARQKSVQDNVAMFVGMALFTLLNYIGQRFFAFREDA